MRALSHEAQLERRVQVTRLRKAGRTKALKDMPGGRQLGDKRLLSAEQERQVQRLSPTACPSG